MNLYDEVLPLVKELLTIPNHPEIPNSRSCAEIAIALDQFLLWMHNNPLQTTPQPTTAAKGNTELTKLRKAVVRQSMPVYTDISYYIPLDQDPVFLQYISDQLKQYDRVVTPLPLLSLDANIVLDVNLHPQYYDPLTQTYEPFHPTDDEDNHDHNDDDDDNDESGNSTISKKIKTNPPPPPKAPVSSLDPHASTPYDIVTDPFSPPRSSQHQAYLGRITTSPTLSLRSLVWKCFVLGPLYLTRIATGELPHSPIPFPYVPPSSSSSSSSSSSTNGTSIPTSSTTTNTTALPPSPSSTAASALDTNDALFDRIITPSVYTDLYAQRPSSSAAAANGALNGNLIYHHEGRSLYSSTDDPGDTISVFSSSTDGSTNSLDDDDDRDDDDDDDDDFSLGNTSISDSLGASSLTTTGNASSNTQEPPSSRPPPLPEPKLYVVAEDYISILKQPKGPLYSKVRDDSFRTFRTSSSFAHSVPEQVLVRLLNAFDVQYQHEWAYCQGINVIAGMFAYVMPELDAYSCFTLFVTKYIPFYWRSNHIAVEAGCVLLHQVVEQAHPEITKAISLVPGLTSLVYAYPFVKTLSGAANPLDEVVHLWDTQLAMGMAFSLFAVASQVISCPQVLDPTQTKSVLDYRKWPILHAETVIKQSCQLILDLHDSLPATNFKQLYENSERYATDPHLITKLTNRQPYAKNNDTGSSKK